MGLVKHVFLIYTQFNHDSHTCCVLHYSVCHLPYQSSMCCFFHFQWSCTRPRPTHRINALDYESKRAPVLCHLLELYREAYRGQIWLKLSHHWRHFPTVTFRYTHIHSWENVMRSRMKPAALSFSFSVLLLSCLEPLWVSPLNKLVMSYLAGFAFPPANFPSQRSLATDGVGNGSG